MVKHWLLRGAAALLMVTAAGHAGGRTVASQPGPDDAVVAVVQDGPRRLPTGTLVHDSPRTGMGTLTIRNYSEFDAVAALTTLTRVPVVIVYVRAGEDVTV